MTSIWDRANRQLRDLAVYEPGKPIEETARELGADRNEIIKPRFEARLEPVSSYNSCDLEITPPPKKPRGYFGDGMPGRSEEPY